MKLKKLLSKVRGVTCVILLSVALIFSGFNFSKPDFAYTAQGVSGTYTVPYSGLYEITAVGCQGAVYNSTAVGGTRVKGKVWLNKGDEVFIYTKTQSKYSTSGDTLTVPHGETTSVSVNGVDFLTALGGHGSCSTSVTSTINKVTISADKRVGNVATTLNVHHHTGSSSNGGGCYVVKNWTGTRQDSFRCGYHAVEDRTGYSGDCPRCGGGVWVSLVGNDVDGDSDGRTDIRCKGDNDYTNPPYTVTYSGERQNSNDTFTGYSVGCGYVEHEVLELQKYLNGTDSLSFLHEWSRSDELIPEGFVVEREVTPTNGYVTIQIAECNNLYNEGVKVTQPYYNDYLYNLVINNDTIVYCKYGT